MGQRSWERGVKTSAAWLALIPGRVTEQELQASSVRTWGKRDVPCGVRVACEVCVAVDSFLEDGILAQLTLATRRNWSTQGDNGGRREPDAEKSEKDTRTNNEQGHRVN